MIADLTLLIAEMVRRSGEVSGIQAAHVKRCDVGPQRAHVLAAVLAD
jgi:hypothetical protein